MDCVKNIMNAGLNTGKRVMNTGLNAGKRVMNTGKNVVTSVVNNTLTRVSDIVRLDDETMTSLKNDFIKVSLSTAAVALAQNNLNQRTVTHEIASRLAGLALYEVVLGKKVRELEASNEKLQKLNFSLTVKLSTVVLVSTVLLSGVEGLSGDKLMKELAGMAVGIAVHNMVTSKFVNFVGAKGDAAQMIDDWAVVVTISVATQLVMNRGNVRQSLSNLLNPVAFKNMVSNILGRNIASVVDYA